MRVVPGAPGEVADPRVRRLIALDQRLLHQAQVGGAGVWVGDHAMTSIVRRAVASRLAGSPRHAL